MILTLTCELGCVQIALSHLPAYLRPCNTSAETWNVTFDLNFMVHRGCVRPASLAPMQGV